MNPSRPRKRDLARKLLPNSAKLRAKPTTTLSTSPSAQAAPSSFSHRSLPVKTAQKFLEDALAELTETEQTIIRNCLASEDEDIAGAIQKSYNSTLRAKEICEHKRWHWNYRGRDISLREEADKVLLWLDQFKSIGDVVANVAPLHVGLPWAGIRLILEACVSESRERAAVVIGMNLALNMANRLRVYFDFFERLHSTIVTEAFEYVLVETYTHILRFLATAIRTCQMNSAQRTWQALWQTSTLHDFETESHRLGVRAEIAASNCDRELREQKWEIAAQWKADLGEALRKLDDIQNIQSSLEKLSVKTDLANLMTAKGATHNSYTEGDFARCLDGTRTQILGQIADWADDPNGRCIFWLCGMAGTGKSTVCRSVAHDLDKQGRLGASFFFKRGEAERGDASRFFPTIARQLADVVPDLGFELANALSADSLLCERNLQEQFEKLLAGPLYNAGQVSTVSSGTILTIDALDECERDTDIKTILTLLARVESISSFRLPIFVTSRPELPIQLGFKKMSGELHHDVVLEEVQASTIEHDLRGYFKFRFDEIKEENSQRQSYDVLPTDWPGDISVDALVQLAIPLFIFPFTVCRYISGPNPRKRLDTILQQRPGMPLSGLGRTYIPILNQLLFEREAQEHSQLIAQFKQLVGPIVLAAEPLSALSLSRLLEIPLRDIGEMLSYLQSVFNIPADCTKPIRLFHLSFRDFLTECKDTEITKFSIDRKKTHIQLVGQCLSRLSQPGVLREDLCRVECPGMRRADISKRHVAASIDAEVAYSCSYWVWHLIESGERIREDGEVHNFLQMHFLHWLEALSWLEKLSKGVTYISQLLSIVKSEQESRLLSFLHDAQRFVMRYRLVIDLAPLQIYHSALVLAPSQSIVRKQFEKRHHQQFSRLPAVPSTWSFEIQKLEGHEDLITSTAFSPDSQMVASASEDRTVRLWNAVTGEQMQSLEGHGGSITSIAFSPGHGRIVASASRDRSIRIWNTRTGEQVHKLEGHDDWVVSVAFCFGDRQTIASASRDRTIRLWNATTGEQIQQFQGRNRSVDSIAFSPIDNSVLVSASHDYSVHIWDILKGEEKQELEGPQEGYNASLQSVVFSPDGQMIAAAAFDHVRLWNTTGKEDRQKFVIPIAEAVRSIAFSFDGRIMASASQQKVQLWNPATGEQIKTLEGHNAIVTTVAFSANGLTIATGSYDCTVRLWTTAISGTREASDPNVRTEGRNDFVKRIIFSPYGKTVASASLDGTMQLWDAASGKPTRKLEGHDVWVACMSFSPDNKIIASASYDRTVRLWQTAMGEQMRTLEHDDCVKFVTFSPNGKLVASGSDDQTVRLWHTATGDKILKFEHGDFVASVAFSSDGRKIASASYDQTAQLWDVLTGDHIRTFRTSATTSDLTFSTAGRALMADAEDVNVGGPSSEASSDSITAANVLRMTESWIRGDWQDVLWLPHEYRGTCSACYGNLLVLGHASGAVSFIEARDV